MGVITDRNGRICCDGCGGTDKVRNRTCPYRVHYSRGGSLPYCSAPHLCSVCWNKHKGLVHATCKAGAARSQERENKRGALEAAGEFLLAAGWGSWHSTVPAGLVGVCFRNLAGEEVWKLVPEADYDQRSQLTTASQFPDAADWTDHESAGTKRFA